MEDLQSAVMEKVDALLLKANETYQIKMPYINVDFNLRGCVAGRAIMPDKVRFNHIFLAENKEVFIDRTVTHEIAHLVAWQVYGKECSGHDWRWREVMQRLGATTITRCHEYDTSTIKASIRSGYRYGCSCGNTWTFIAKRHLRIQAGATFHCRACNTSIIWLDKEKA